MILQCRCSGCPTSAAQGQDKLTKIVEQELWDNGQKMLVNVARKAGLKFGPNRAMQKLMAERNDKISALMHAHDGTQGPQISQRIAVLNAEYGKEISWAASVYPDVPAKVVVKRSGDADQRKRAIIIVVVTCTVVVLLCVSLTTVVIIRTRKREDTVMQFEGEHVVTGMPCDGNQGVHVGDVQGGTPVTVTAPTQVKSALSTFEKECW
jgi:hypothetical protein